MIINIQGVSTDKNTKLFNDALEYFCSKMMTKKMINTLTINLTLKEKMIIAGSSGGCWSESDGSKPTKIINIEIFSKEGVDKQLEFLAHESVHLFQIAENTLQNREWKTDNKIHTRWNGQDFGLRTEIDYDNCPWEVEAYKLQIPLYHGFLVKQFGKPGDEDRNSKEIAIIMKEITRERASQSEFVY